MRGCCDASFYISPLYKAKPPKICTCYVRGPPRQPLLRRSNLLCVICYQILCLCQIFVVLHLHIDYNKSIMNSPKGFTLIELLVVISIIGILSRIVLASISTARIKSTDTSIQSTLSNMRAQAELYYTYNGKYGVNSLAITSPDNACDASGLSTTMFVITGQGSLSSLLINLKNKVTAVKVACAVFPTTKSASITDWAASAQLKGSNDFWCVDNTGTSKKVLYVTSTLNTPEKAISTSAVCK
jgi:prepilin-type N-terminal cleavage/methylation domain-containing protein